MTTGIWSIIVPIVAMFLGGLAAARVAGPLTRSAAAIHGAVLWSLATLAAVVMLVSVVSRAVSGVTRLGAGAVGGAGAAIGALPGDLMQRAGIDADDLLGPVNERLRAQNKPEVTSEQLGAATRDVLQTAVREGRFDRELLVTSLAEHTPLSEQDAREVAATVEQRWNQQASGVAQKARGFGVEARGAVLQAAESTGKGLIALFFAMLLGLVAAVAGTVVGLPRSQRRAAS